ncbi:MAG TPA: flagellar filament capping protein FliD, partial [Lachnospiraceae bacterium]|nr:flagellar filament capping protein FliD [Lachnospiraceae bacterium]
MSIRITGISSNLDTDSMVEELVSAYKEKGEDLEKDQTLLSWKQDAWEDLSSEISTFYSKTLNNMRFSSTYTEKETTVSDETKATVVASDNAVNGTQTLEVTSLAKAAYLTGGELSTTDDSTLSSSSTLADLGYTGDTTTITVNQGEQKEDGTYDTVTFDISSDTTISEFVSYMSAAGYNANFDSSSGRIFIGSQDSGAADNFDFDTASLDEDGTAALNALGLLDDGVKIDGQNATIILNGAEFESDTNTFTINGLTVTAKSLTEEDSPITLITDTDYDSIYDSIRDFFSDYNSLINEMDALYNADSADDYEPLTDDEKDEMSDTEIEAWEEKIKDAILRRDDTLSTVSSVLKDAMLQTYTVDGTTLSLSSFGISTLGYFDAADNEKNAYHIDGDEDDDDTSGNDDQLMSAIASDPEQVASFFQQLAQNLYTSLSKQMSTNEYRSYGSFYNDKLMDEEYDDYTDKIEDWDDYVDDLEERYYQQF